MQISDGQIACDIFIYADDVCMIGGSEEECWQVSHKAASALNWPGLQDAAHK